MIPIQHSEKWLSTRVLGASTGQYQRKGGKSRGGVRKGGKSRGGVEWNLLEREKVHVLKNDVVCEKVFAYVRT